MPLLIAAFLLGAAHPPVPAETEKASALAPTSPNAAAADDDSPPTPAAIAAQPDDDDAKLKAGARSNKGEEDADDEEEGSKQPASRIVVTAHRLDAARTQIDAGLGATVYSLTNDAIENRPGGETGSVADILTQAPGVTLSGNTLEIRGSAANQLRINNVIIPEAIPDPADLISSRLAETTRLISGTLPAQFGFAPAGVISVTTKNGLYQHGGEAELFAGSTGMIEPAFEWAGSLEDTSLFASGELEHERSTIADAEGNAAPDRRTRIDGLGFADHIIDDKNRISLILGGSHERHRIGETSIGAGTETNSDAYGVASYQHSAGGFTLQTSFFAGTATDAARFGSASSERRSSWGTQIDASEAAGAANIVRFGLLATRSTARDLGAGGGDVSADRTSLGVYAQDEWRPAKSLTLVWGGRLEWLDGLDSTPTIEPRASLVFEPVDGLTTHVGYARYASAPPLGEEAAAIMLPDEHDDYVDAGIQHKIGAFVVGVDGYWRFAHNYIAEHRTPGTAIATAFEFKRARIRGVELSGTYAHGRTTAWANVSLSHAEGKTIVGGEGLFAPQSITGALANYVPLGSDRPLTASAGLTQRIDRLSLGGDLLLSSGAVRTTNFADPNGSRHSAYALLGASAVYHVRIAGQPADFRLDVTNLTNVHAATSDATSLEGDWTRRSQGRAITIGIEQSF